jgi:hypothetical protein
MSSSGMLRHVPLVFLRSVHRLLVTANVVPSSLILVTLMVKAQSRFLQEPHGVTSQTTAFFSGSRVFFTYNLCGSDTTESQDV